MSILVDAPNPPVRQTKPGRGKTRSVLCAIDGAALASGRVLPAGVTIARARDARLVLLAVVRRPSIWTLLSGYSPARLRAECEDQAVSWLAEALARVPADVDAHVVLRHGDPAETIGAEVLVGDYDAIVLGRRPRPHHGRRRNSVSAKVVSNAGVPIHVVPLPPTTHAAEPSDPGPL
jgi:nucleotide-binding universal stress UspA family protein